LGTETILLVDDEEFIRDLGRKVLTRAGYKVLTAVSGKEALDIYQEKGSEIDLIILDLIMPEMSGKECLGKLLEINPKARILIASGYFAEGPVRAVTEGLARGFIAKPYNLNKLLRLVREALERESARHRTD
jgi:two-component system, cell cycle sensor histidine kinase and response regulator CckA